MKALISVLLLLAGFTAIYLAVTDSYQTDDLSSKRPTPTTLNGWIENDLELLKQQNQLPNEWQSILEQKVLTTSPLTEKLSQEIQPKVPLNKNGKYRLEYVLIAENPNEQKSRLLIQYGLYDIKSQNKIWEKIRVYKR